MAIRIPKVLSAEELVYCRDELLKADWSDGRHSAGYLSRAVKDNHQLPDDHPLAARLGKIILRALGNNDLFTTAALPMKMVPPLFNRYSDNQTYGRHVDGAIRPVAGTDLRVRTDLSATLFLCDPEDYDGGELCIEDSYGPRSIKLPAGDMVLYPGTSVHYVRPVTHGVRLASFFWIQSMVRQEQQRTILFELDSAIQKMAGEDQDQIALTDLAGVYHNLLRMWADS